MTANYLQHRKFRGVDTKIQGSRILIEIRMALPQRNTAPSVGLNDALLEYADRTGKTIYVSVLYPKANFKTTAKEWIKRAKKEEQPSYYNRPWFIYRGVIPRIAFMNEEERERLAYYEFYAR